MFRKTIFGKKLGFSINPKEIFKSDEKFHLECQRALRESNNFLKKLDKKIFHYHCIEHTIEYVFPTTMYLAVYKSQNFNVRELLLLAITALFHDTGCIEGYKGHEGRSCRYLINFMRSSPFIEYTKKEYELVEDMIMKPDVTNPNHDKQLNKHSQILKDADLSYVGTNSTEDFFKWIELLYEESLQLYWHGKSDAEKNAFLPTTAVKAESEGYVVWLESSLYFMDHVQDWFSPQGV